MRSFRDTAGREWTIAVNVASLARVQTATGIDLTKILKEDSGTDDKLAEHAQLWDVLCELLRQQLDNRDVSREQLGEALDEEAAEKAVLALYEATIDFFRGPKREAMGRAFRKTIEAAETAREKATARIVETLQSPDFAAAVEAAVGGKPSPGSSPAASESTPAPEHCASST